MRRSRCLGGRLGREGDIQRVATEVVGEDDPLEQPPHLVAAQARLSAGAHHAGVRETPRALECRVHLALHPIGGAPAPPLVGLGEHVRVRVRVRVRARVRVRVRVSAACPPW